MTCSGATVVAARVVALGPVVGYVVDASFTGSLAAGVGAGGTPCCGAASVAASGDDRCRGKGEEKGGRKAGGDGCGTHVGFVGGRGWLKKLGICWKCYTDESAESDLI